MIKILALIVTRLTFCNKEISTPIYLQILAFRVPELLEILVQSELGELVLQMYPEVHILDRVHDYIDKLHTGDHEFYVKTVVLGEICHKCRESSPLGANFFEVIERRQDDLVAALYQADRREELQHQSLRSEKPNEKGDCF